MTTPRKNALVMQAPQTKELEVKKQNDHQNNQKSLPNDHNLLTKESVISQAPNDRYC